MDAILNNSKRSMMPAGHHSDSDSTLLPLPKSAITWLGGIFARLPPLAARLNPKNTKKSPIHENTNAKITCDFGDDRCRIASARLEKDIFVKTHLHTSPIVVKISECI